MDALFCFVLFCVFGCVKKRGKALCGISPFFCGEESACDKLAKKVVFGFDCEPREGGFPLGMDCWGLFSSIPKGKWAKERILEFLGGGGMVGG